MAKLTSEEWNDRYATAELIWGAEPNQFLVREVAELRPGTALDLATGEGRNAIWLARQGWRVTGLDFSAVALDKAREIATDLGVAVDWVHADVVGYQPEPAGFDLVTILYLHLERPERRQVLAAASAAVAPGGTLLIVGHDLENLTRGHGGPQDPARLWVADEAVEELVGLVVEQAGQVVRLVETDAGTVEAIDTLIRARRA
jgi:2-polyprenyl-3-methyl-5-hydroxy-6-metoxy-1,4-benzoquinol methylase